MVYTHFIRLLLTTGVVSIGLLSCQRVSSDELQPSSHGQISHTQEHGDQYRDPRLYDQGVVIVRLRDDLVPELRIGSPTPLTLHSVSTPFAAALSSIQAYSLTPLFPEDSRYPKRRRRAGLHRWYKVQYDTSVDLPQAMTTLSTVPEVEIVEAAPVARMLSTHTGAPLSLGKYFDRSATMPYDDPLLPSQWHYNNTGELEQAVMGADINLFKAWEISTGTPNVIVAVVDGGIDTSHPDLVDNLWVNTAEANGVEGVDDDGNGYVDDIHGYCFVAMTPDLRPDPISHGTHVAGTVAARTNNGIGVAGVAGGDGTPSSGVRLMSTAIFRAGASNSADRALVYAYGADNGAVISQNSWGLEMTSAMPEYLKDAIDYFIDNAGCDDDGRQLPDAPMKGGIVICAAGNNGLEFPGVPGAYERVIAVAANRADYRKAVYSTYGSYVDISAPGGDMQPPFSKQYGVVSTLAPYIVISGESYGGMDGTSMACPHVSGVAALILSKHGGPGYTADQLRRHLLASVAPVSIDELNPGFEGKLGAGIVDAYAALTIEDKGVKPNTPQVLVEESDFKEFLHLPLTWIVPEDQDDGAPIRYRAYVSKDPLTPANFKSKGRATGNINGYIDGNGRVAGETMSAPLLYLTHSTHYYVALVAIDRWGHESEPTIVELNTKHNKPVDISSVPTEPITLIDSKSTVTHHIPLADPDGHSWSYTASGDTKGVSIKKDADGLSITIRPVLPEGDHMLELDFTDELGTRSHAQIPFRIIHAAAPKLLTPLSAQILDLRGGAVSLDLAAAFEHHKYLPLSFVAKSSNDEVATAEVDPESGRLTLRGHRVGHTSIIITAYHGDSTTQTTIEVAVTEDKSKSLYAVWPIPVGNVMNLWINPKHKSAKVQLMHYNGRVELLQTVTTDHRGMAMIETSKVAPGHYQLVIDTGSGEVIRTSMLKK